MEEFKLVAEENWKSVNWADNLIGLWVSQLGLKCIGPTLIGSQLGRRNRRRRVLVKSNYH